MIKKKKEINPRTCSNHDFILMYFYLLFYISLNKRAIPVFFFQGKDCGRTDYSFPGGRERIWFHFTWKGWKEEYINAGQRGPRFTWQRGMNHRDLLGTVPATESYSYSQ